MGLGTRLAQAGAALTERRRAGRDALAARAAARAKPRAYGPPLDLDPPAEGTPPPDEENFACLDRLTDADAATREALRDHVFNWLEAHARGDTLWRPPGAGRRLARLALHHGFLAKGADAERKTALEQALGTHLAFLRARADSPPDPRERIEAISGWLIGALAAQDGKDVARATEALGAAAKAAIDAQGGVASRNPDDLAAIFLRLAAALAACAARQKEPPREAVAALTRAAPALRSLRHADGRTPRLQGGAGSKALAEALDLGFALAGPLARGQAARAALGIQRMAAGRSVALLDAAPPPDTANAASCLHGLEFSHGRQILFASVGAGDAFGPDWRAAARGSSAFSTLEVGGRALSLEAARAAAPRIERVEDAQGRWALAEHEGWSAAFGLTASRRLNLSPDGLTLKGEDALSCADAAARARFDAAAQAGGAPFLLRFHLHPGAVAEFAALERLRLILPDESVWSFSFYGAELTVEDGAWLDAGAKGPKRCKLIAARGRAEAYWGRIAWTLAREK